MDPLERLRKNYVPRCQECGQELEPDIIKEGFVERYLAHAGVCIGCLLRKQDKEDRERWEGKIQAAIPEIECIPDGPYKGFWRRKGTRP